VRLQRRAGSGMTTTSGARNSPIGPEAATRGVSGSKLVFARDGNKRFTFLERPELTQSRYAINPNPSLQVAASDVAIAGKLGDSQIANCITKVVY
jgi:hypothetical protein